MIKVERLQQALTYLAETDEKCGILRADVARAEFKAKSIKNTLMKAILKGSIPDRTAEAETSQEYLDAKMLEFQRFGEYEGMKNKRATESILIDVWRSLNAGRRSGQVM